MQLMTITSAAEHLSFLQKTAGACRGIGRAPIPGLASGDSGNRRRSHLDMAATPCGRLSARFRSRLAGGRCTASSVSMSLT